jgi:hypothetical protein
MSERSERIISTGFAQALCAEPLTGATGARDDRTIATDVKGHQ